MDWMLVKKATPDALLDKLGHEKVLRMFKEARTTANTADAARDRLRDYVKDHVPAGQHGPFVLDKVVGSERAYANSDGLHYLRDGLIIAGPQVEPGFEVTVRDKDGHVISRGIVVDNKGLYTSGGSMTLKLIELPEV